MKNPCLTFRGTCGTEEYDRIMTTEVYPAVIKAFGSLSDGYQTDFLCAATEHFINCMTELAHECRDTYLHQKVDAEQVERVIDYLDARESTDAAVWMAPNDSSK